MWTDTHAHLASGAFNEDRSEVIRRAVDAGVTRIVCVGDTLATSEASIRLAAEWAEVWATAGIHPHEAAKAPDELEEALWPLLEQPKVVAVGEVGLDYYHKFSPIETQHRVFREQIRIAKKRGLPLIIHNREASEDVIRILREEDAGSVGGVLHCFWGTLETARAALGMGFYLGVGGPVTFKNSDDLRSVLAELPVERLVVETDCPYLAPVPHRGKRNEPAHVVHSGRALARLLGMDDAELADITSRNAATLFGLR